MEQQMAEVESTDHVHDWLMSSGQAGTCIHCGAERLFEPKEGFTSGYLLDYKAASASIEETKSALYYAERPGWEFRH